MRKITASAPGAHVNGPTNMAEHMGGQAAWFVNGEAYVADNHPYVRYAEGVPGYTVTTVASAPQAYTDAVAAMKAGTSLRQGSQLRDAAVDPQPGDASVPTNAGQPGPLGNPHGPHVVAPEALTREAQAKARGEQLPELEVPPWR